MKHPNSFIISFDLMRNLSWIEQVFAHPKEIKNTCNSIANCIFDTFIGCLKCHQGFQWRPKISTIFLSIHYWATNISIKEQTLKCREFRWVFNFFECTWGLINWKKVISVKTISGKRFVNVSREDWIFLIWKTRNVLMFFIYSMM